MKRLFSLSLSFENHDRKALGFKSGIPIVFEAVLPAPRNQIFMHLLWKFWIDAAMPDRKQSLDLIINWFASEVGIKLPVRDTSERHVESEIIYKF